MNVSIGNPLRLIAPPGRRFAQDSITTMNLPDPQQWQVMRIPHTEDVFEVHSIFLSPVLFGKGN